MEGASVSAVERLNETGAAKAVQNPPPTTAVYYFGGIAIVVVVCSVAYYLYTKKRQPQKPLQFEKESHWIKYFISQKDLVVLSIENVSAKTTGTMRTLALLDESVQIFEKTIYKAISPEEFFQCINTTIDIIVNAKCPTEASFVLGKLTTATLNGHDAFDHAFSGVRQWCSLSKPLLSTYLDLLQLEETMDCSTVLTSLFEEGIEDMKKVAEGLQECLNYLTQVQQYAQELAAILNGPNKATGLLENAPKNEQSIAIRHNQEKKMPEPQTQYVSNLTYLVESVGNVQKQIHDGWGSLQRLHVIEALLEQVNNPTAWQQMDEASTSKMISIVKHLMKTCRALQIP